MNANLADLNRQNEHGQRVEIDRGVLNDLIRRCDRQSDEIVRDLGITSAEFFRWRYSTRVPPSMIRMLAEAIGATVQELLHIPADTLVDMTALANGWLIVFGDEDRERESRGLEPLRIRDYSDKPFRRRKLEFGVDGMLMGVPYRAVPGRPRIGK